MANTKISGLTASASNIAATDVLPVVQTTGVGPVKMSGLQLAGGLLGSATFNGSTVTTSQPVLNLSQTWNAGAVTFKGLVFNATDTASAAASLLLDLQTGGVTKAQINKAGGAQFASDVSVGYSGSGNYPTLSVRGTDGRGVAMVGRLGAGLGIYAPGAAAYTYINLATESSFGTNAIIGVAAAASLQLGAADGAAPVAQTLQVQSVVGGTSNTAGANFTIAGSKGTGTGAGGSIIFQVAPAGTAGTAQNGYQTALTIAGNSNATFYAGLFAQGASAQNIVSISAFNTVAVGSLCTFSFGSGTTVSGSNSDVFLARDAANTLALRNSTSAQTFNVYNTYTDASNYERAALTWSSNVAYLRAQNAGTGSSRLMVPVTGSTTVASLPSASTAGAGARSFVTDANATTFLSTVAGGGANKVPVVSDGTNWLIG